MSAPIPSQIPAELTAGDTAIWKICLPDFPANDGWVLSYVFMRLDSGLKINVTSTADGSDHLVNVPASETVNWTDGEYNVHGYASKDADRFKVWSGSIKILPDYSTAEGIDTRSNARKTLDAIEAGILKIHQSNSTARAGNIVSWAAEGLSITRESQSSLLAELTKQRDRWKAIVRIEQDKELIAQGRATGRRILTRFKR